MKNFLLLPLAVIAVLINLIPINAQSDALINPIEKTTLFDSFYSEDCIDITLESDFEKLVNNKKKEVYQKAWMSYTTKEGVKTKRSVLIKPRGKSRRMICDFPPIKLKFSKDELEADGLTADNKLKIVTHCLERRSKEGQQNLLKEYLTYKLLNILTDKSFRVQLVRITYIDSLNHDTSQRYGIIIEGKKGLAQRLNSTSFDKRGIPVSDLDPTQYNTVALFQYMIGNTDWKLPMLHNTKLFNSGNSRNLIIVPYDFDYAGLVNARYAALDPIFDQEDSRDRVFLGQFANEEDLNKTLDLFKSKKDEILLYCQNFNKLYNWSRKEIVRYLKSFYKDIERSRFVKREFLGKRAYYSGY